MTTLHISERNDAGTCGVSPAIFTCPLDSGWSGEFFDRLDTIDPSVRQGLFPPGWKDHRYYQILEETFAGEFQQHYLVLRDEEGSARVLQPFFLVAQDLTVSLSPVWRALLRPLRFLLRSRLLMVGCIVGEGHIGVSDVSEVPTVCGPLDQALSLFAERTRVRIILFKDFPTVYRAAFTPLTDGGSYTRLPSLPAVRLPLDFASFEEYMQNHLGRATRKSLRRKFRDVDTLAEPIRLEVKSSVTPAEATALHALYERVALHGSVHFEVFTADYFLRMGEWMPGQARFFIWRWGGKIVAFSFCTIHDGTIYDHDLGMDEACALPLHLYHVTFRDIVRWALAQRIRHYQSSPFNYEPKLRLNMQLLPLDLYARHTSPLGNRLLRWVAPCAAPTRQEPLLSHFPNAGSL